MKREISAGSIIHSDGSMEHNELTEFGYSHCIINHNEFYAYEDAQKRKRLWMPLMLFYKSKRKITPKILSRYMYCIKITVLLLWYIYSL